MALLPDIEDGKIQEPAQAPKLFNPPKFFFKKTEEGRLADLNNLGREVEPEDYSNSRALDY